MLLILMENYIVEIIYKIIIYNLIII